MTTILEQLKALPSFLDAGYKIPPHVTSHQTKDALSPATVDLLCELQRIIEVPAGTASMGSSAICVRYDTYTESTAVALAKLKARLGPMFRPGVGGKPWGSSYGPNGAPQKPDVPGATWTPPLHAGWASHLTWTKQRLQGLSLFSPRYATWDEEWLVYGNVPGELWPACTNAEVAVWTGFVNWQSIVPYKCARYAANVPIESFVWRTGQLYSIHDMAASRNEMTLLGAEPGPRAMWLWLNVHKTSTGYDGEVTPQQAYALGIEMYGAGQDLKAPWSQLDLVVFYECAGVNDIWWRNFIAYAKGALGLSLE